MLFHVTLHLRTFSWQCQGTSALNSSPRMCVPCHCLGQVNGVGVGGCLLLKQTTDWQRLSSDNILSQHLPLEYL